MYIPGGKPQSEPQEKANRAEFVQEPTLQRKMVSTGTLAVGSYLRGSHVERHVVSERAHTVPPHSSVTSASIWGPRRAILRPSDVENHMKWRIPAGCRGKNMTVDSATRG